MGLVIWSMHNAFLVFLERWLGLTSIVVSVSIHFMWNDDYCIEKLK